MVYPPTKVDVYIPVGVRRREYAHVCILVYVTSRFPVVLQVLKSQVRDPLKFIALTFVAIKCSVSRSLPVVP